MKSALALLLGLTGATAYDCLPDTVTDGVMTFADGCTKVVLPNPGTWYDNYASSITEPFSVVLPDSVTEISNYAFAGSPVSSINLNKVWRIGAYAFFECMELETVVFPTRPYIIEQGAFSNQGSNQASFKLKTLDFGVTDIDKGKGVNSGHSADPSRTNKVQGYYSGYDSDNPYDQQTIDMDAFKNAWLTSINLGSVTYIRDGAFYGCGLLPNVTIPPSVKKIEVAAFQNMQSLTEVIFPSELDPEVTYGDTNGYVDAQMNPNQWRYNSGGAFTDNAALITVSNVNSNVFRYNPFHYIFGHQVKHVTLLDSVTEIPYDAFRSSALESINLNKVQTVGNFAFLGTQLTQVILPIDATIGFGAFNDAFDTGVVRVDAVLGCTDTTATNYDDTANTDDGSCAAAPPAAPPAADPPADPAPTGGCEAGLTATEYQSRGCCEC